MTAPRRPRTEAEAREAVLDQLAYLSDEMEALRPLIGRVPPLLLEGRPLPEEWSIKETLGLIAAADDAVRRRWFERLAAEKDPELEVVEERTLAESAPWNEMPPEDILLKVAEARNGLVAYLRTLPGEVWNREAHAGEHSFTMLQIAHSIVEADMQYLRDIGMRLHESNLSQKLGGKP